VSDPPPFSGPPPYPQASAPAEDDWATEEAVRTLTRVRIGVNLLRALAIAAVCIWLVAFFSTIAFQWSVLDQNSSLQGSIGIVQQTQDTQLKVFGVVSAAAESTWGYALVAAVAFSASLWFDNTRANELLADLDDSDGDDS
jgi:hypothetical protein